MPAKIVCGDVGIGKGRKSGRSIPPPIGTRLGHASRPRVRRDKRFSVSPGAGCWPLPANAADTIRADDIDFIAYMLYAWQPSDRFLHKLLQVEGRQPT